ncbi:hypothetical protein CRENPOLYSF2_2970003 [Crenothrix polyspora]|uniref:Uncharacterized protein n=1 Tax=Crenothrix polyspora TaxID=360316 RepID=A0A1R4H9F2_9GAMM|nr:hypothetical protein CRENPOLYSF2_2970003 [Crenothrix polyspora]
MLQVLCTDIERAGKMENGGGASSVEN